LPLGIVDAIDHRVAVRAIQCLKEARVTTHPSAAL
jgi:hypothetical protein